MRNDNFLGIKLMKYSTNKLAEIILTKNFISKISPNDLNRVYWGVNPAYLYRGFKYFPEYIKVLRKSENVYVDGQSIVFLYNLFKKENERIPERSATTDLFPKILELNTIYKRRIYLLGSKEENVRKVYENYKMFNIVGYHNGYFDKDGLENEEVINEINDLKIDILFVGFGNPLQEKWILRNLEKIKASVIIPCGGLFDHYSVYRRAPKVYIHLGLEWLWRLVEDRFSKYRRTQVKESILFFVGYFFGRFSMEENTEEQE